MVRDFDLVYVQLIVVKTYGISRWFGIAHENMFCSVFSEYSFTCITTEGIHEPETPERSDGYW